jgi:DNA-binding response OmpR family regulator
LPVPDPDNPKVLVADDEEGIRVLCRVNLELAGYEVAEAADGAQALDAARSVHPDVIFLDVMMPIMDGWEVLRTLKEDPATAVIPVIMLTARTSEADQIRAWGEGVMQYLAKPFSPEMLEEFAALAMTPHDAAAEQERRQRVIEQLRNLQELRRRA